MSQHPNQNNRREDRDLPATQNALGRITSPLALPVQELLGDSVNRGEHFKLEMQKGDSTLEVEYIPERDGKRRVLTLRLEG